VRWFAVLATVFGLVGCGPSGIVSSGGDASESDGGDPADGDGDPGDGDGDEPGDGDVDEPPDLPAACEPVIDDWVWLHESSSPAEFAALSCVEEITGNLLIESTTVGDLAFLSSLVRVGRDLKIEFNDGLLDLTGLNALEQVGGELSITSNDSLLSLEGLDSLHSVHGLSVLGNDSLPSVAGLSGPLHLHAFEQATHVRIEISSNHALTSLDGLADITGLTTALPLELHIVYNSQLGGDLFGLSNLVSDEQQLDLLIDDNPLDSLVGLEALTTAANVRLFGPDGHFTSLAGLDNLTTVTGELRIGECTCLLPEVNPDCYADAGFELLESLDGLESLVEVGSLYIWGNESLVAIDGLSNLASAGDVTITENPVLPAMAVTDLLARVEITGMLSTDMNGNGVEPMCSIFP
jgi:hypothetical protein